MTPSDNTELQRALGQARGSFLAVGGFSLVINLLMLVPVIYMLQLYDRVVPTGNQSTLLMLTVIVLFLFAVMGALDWIRSQILVRVGTRLEAGLRERLFEVAFHGRLSGINKNASAQPIDDFRNLRQFLSGSGMTAVFDAPCMPLYIGAMFVLHPWFGWAAVATGLLVITVALINQFSTGRLIDKATRTANAGRGRLNSTLANAEVIESMGMSGDLGRRWSADSNKVLALQSTAASRSGLLTALSRHLRMAAQSMVLGIGAYLAIAGEVSPGLMIAGSILLGRALAPIDVLVGNWKGFVNARAEYRRLNELLRAVPTQPERMELPTPKGALKVEHAVINPPGSRAPVVKAVSFEIAPGEVVGLIGPSGSGKSTLVRALLGIWNCQQGHVRLDGADIATLDRSRLGPHIGYLPQDIELFDGTVSENIARFVEPDPEQVVAAAKLAGVHELILRLPDGYDTRIGIGGCMLSGGQRQRLGLARALYGKPALVVLDEPNSNLDDAGDAALHHALRQLGNRGTTVIIVTHRPSVLRTLDKLLVLQDGTIKAFGPPGQVMSDLKLATGLPAKAISTPADAAALPDRAA